MPSSPRLEIAAAAPVRPPLPAVMQAVTRRQAQGFDAVWWADHLLHWFPASVWSPDLVPQAASQASPHVWCDPFALAAAAAGHADRIRLGVGVTDLVRRHPAALAQTALTLDHVTGGRFILGVGTGEALNIAALGLDNARPLARLREGLDVMRLLFSTPGEVDFDGEFFTLRGAAVGLRPAGERPPPVWVAAHRPRGLRLVGEAADGWLPLCTDPVDYAGMWARVRAAAAQAGRAAPVPGLYTRVVLAEDDEIAQRAAAGSLLLRFIALTAAAEAYAAHGAAHPLGEGVFGLTEFRPTGLGREEALRLAGEVPEAVVLDTVVAGTPSTVAGRLAALVAAGARHVQVVNMTPLASPELAPSGEALLGEALAELRLRVGGAA
ncbi:MAG TPA: LLM class flavin-dependent oxidoreductase [Miltoncostaeaceae bacterium]|nr:LLM class flavin-dependent oxidoreductase [Miltoncostaeaceae bacterium]